MKLKDWFITEPAKRGVTLFLDSGLPLKRYLLAFKRNWVFKWRSYFWYKEWYTKLFNKFKI